MNKATDRVRALAEKGALDPREAERLLAAMEVSRGRASALARVLNPFARVGTGAGLALAALVAALGVAVAVTAGVRFDGFLDLHVGKPSLAHALLDQASALAPATLVFWAAARIAARAPGVRLVDIAVVVGLARAPLSLLGGPIALLAPKFTPGVPPAMTLGLGAMILLSIVAVAGHVTWLWQGFRTASGLPGARAIVAFLVAIVGSEILSKLLLSLAR